ncbi:MAG: hypothetical protein Ct9H300mP1_32470 [Planctomycetaceae bacterium]|nr:MAG: hypothetical protein Ct9H300mP1_32470 [Planctomycetaceae bacterium]
MLVDGKWHHLVVTSDRDADGIMYPDGRVVGRTPIKAVSSIADFGAPVALQLGASTNGFAGDLDDVAIWDRVIDALRSRDCFSRGHGRRFRWMWRPSNGSAPGSRRLCRSRSC